MFSPGNVRGNCIIIIQSLCVFRKSTLIAKYFNVFINIQLDLEK